MSDETEVQRLRAEVAALQAELATKEAATPAPAPAAPRSGTGWFRPLLASALIVLAALLAPVTVIANWAHDLVTDTDRYVETVAPLAEDPAVKAAVSEAVTQAIMEALNVDELTAQALQAMSEQDFVPPQVAPMVPGLATPLSDAVEGFVHDTTDQFVNSERFEQAWETANREAHAQAVAVLTGEGSETVHVADGTVALNIAPFVAAAKERLAERGFGLAERIPEIDKTIVIFHSEQLSAAQTAVSWLSTVARILPFLALAALVGGVLLMPDRRKGLLAAGIAVAATMALLGLALNIVRPLYLGAVPEGVLPHDAAAAVYDQVTLFLTTALRAVLVVAVALVVIAFLLARSGAGATVRRGIGAGLGRLSETSGISRGPVSRFAYEHVNLLRAVVAGIAVLWYVLLPHPTGADALIILVVAVVALLLVQLVAGPRNARSELAEEPSGAAAAQSPASAAGPAAGPTEHRS
ncbi:hypothetical protein [Brachybacterium sp. YJGR34]|uniref:hypothetical protein n=1 Tax=Brachybacterium sp. YJGR34 TaxID=2059911 RepID=UPI000E09F40C|nr:hypothetical protein [Brachybacterium sp. YJGR34]